MTQNTPDYRKVLREFLQIYRSEPCLWQIKNESYYNRAKKNAALDKLAKKYREIDRNADRDAVSRKINALRTTYKREKRKMEACKQIGETYEPRLWYYRDLSFVDNQDAPPCSNLKEEEDEDTVKKQYIDFVDDHDNHDSNNESNNDADAYISDDNLQTNELLSVRTTTRSKVKRRRESRVDNASQSIYYYDPNDRANSRDETANEDRHDIYCKYLACRLRDLPRQQRVLAENLINNVLFQAEMGNLTMGFKVVDIGTDPQCSAVAANHSSQYANSVDPLNQSDTN